MYGRKILTAATAATTLAGILAAGDATAGERSRAGYVYSQRPEYVYARVVRVEPVMRLVTVQRPREECWDETVYVASQGGTGVAGPAIAGGLIGGALGRQFGSGRGRDAMTLAGAIAGSAVATNRATRRQAATAVPTTVERCAVRTERVTEERIEGYDVTYQYHGHRYRMRTSEPPGKRVRLRVRAVPVGY